MVINFKDFLNEEIVIGEPKRIYVGDRVVCHGTVDDYGEESKHLDIEGKTGIIAHVHAGGYRFCGVVFDNYISNTLNDLDRRLKINRGKWIPADKIEVVPENIKGKRSLKFSSRFKKVFEYVEFIDCPIMTSDINYIDVTDKPDTISYLSKDRIERLDIWNEDDYDTIQKIYSSSLRQEMKIGRFIQIINPYTEKFSLDRKIDIYKSAYKNLILKKYNFKMVSGEDIRYWYDMRNYYVGVGSLNRSCMRNSMDRLDLYCDNPDKIGMLIMTSDDNKLLGRALVWKVDKPECVYLDRPYTVFQEDIQTFYNYANEQGWHTYDKYSNSKMIVYLKKDYGDPDRNPFMDTFSVFCITGENGKNYLTTTRLGCEDYYLYEEA